MLKRKKKKKIHKLGDIVNSCLSMDRIIYIMYVCNKKKVVAYNKK